MNKNNEKGGVIVFIACIIGVLLFMVGVVLDTGITTSSKTAYENTANMIALAALKSFSASDQVLNSQKLQDSVIESQAVAQNNFDLWLGKGFMEDPSQTQSDVTLTGGQNGQLTPGYWFHTKPAGCNGTGSSNFVTQGMIEGWMSRTSNCPCAFDTTRIGVDNDGWKGACFIEVTDLNHSNTSITAMKVNLNTNPNSGIAHTISQIFSGSKSFGISTEAIAAYIPRHILMAVDLSPSIAEETHSDSRLEDPNSSTGILNSEVYGEFVYQIAPTDSTKNIRTIPTWPYRHSGNAGGAKYTSAIDFSPLPLLPPVEINPATKYFEIIESQSFSCLSDGYGDPANVRTFLDSTLGLITETGYCDNYFASPGGATRSQSDYELMTVNTTDGDRDSDSNKQAMSNATFLVDLHSGTAPEPLTSVINGVHSTLTSFQNRGFDSDRIGVVGFDDDILNIRSTTQAGASGQQLALLSIKDPEYQNWIDDTNTSSNPRGYLSRLFFPRIFSGEAFVNNLMDPPYTESAMPSVMGEALTMFANAPDKENAQAMMILFTDGLATCPDSDPGESVGMGNERNFTIGSSLSPSFDQDFELDGFCNADSAQHNLLAIEDMVEMARDNFATANVAIHIFLFGTASAPHTVPKSDGSGGILQDSVLRANIALDQYSVSDTMVMSQYYHTINNILPGDGSGARVLSGNFDASGNATDNIEKQNFNYQNRSSTFPWYLPNHLYAAARYTRGHWKPVRPACQPGVDITPQIVALASSKDLPYNTALVSWDDGVNGWGSPVMDNTGTTQLFPTFIDQNGRLVCDPKGRDVNTLIEEELQEIIDENPFVVVSEGTEGIINYK